MWVAEEEEVWTMCLYERAVKEIKWNGGEKSDSHQIRSDRGKVFPVIFTVPLVVGTLEKEVIKFDVIVPTDFINCTTPKK